MAKRTRTPASKSSAIPTSVPTKVSRADMLSAIAGDSKKVITMDQALRPVRYIPTIFPSLNRALQLGGAPLCATYVLHGPPGGAKTAVALGLASSFTRQQHAAAVIEAEHALSKKWAVKLNVPMEGILFNQPDNFEEAIDLVDGWIENFKTSKESGRIPEDRGFIIIIDTIHKMPPKYELKQMRSANKGGGAENINKGWGRYRANMISSWIDSLTPKVGKNDIAFVALAHEKDAQQDQDKDKDWYADDYRVKGGKSLLFEAMVRLRCRATKRIFEARGGKKILVGREHKIMVEKNKVGFPHDEATIYIGNGRGSMPLGFDLAQEAFVEAKARDLLEISGSNYTFPGEDETTINGRENAIEYLRTHPDAYEELYDLLNDTIEMIDEDELEDQEE
jgi:recombination protein RecA